jgi:hypothetical protein
MKKIKSKDMLLLRKEYGTGKYIETNDYILELINRGL